jgi:hypothetical protein
MPLESSASARGVITLVAGLRCETLLLIYLAVLCRKLVNPGGNCFAVLRRGCLRAALNESFA